MLYLLDANVLIDAIRDYYPLKRVPEFWKWLLNRCRAGEVKIPSEIYNEVVPPGRRDDELTKWMRKNRRSIELPEVTRKNEVDHVIRSQYVRNPTLADLDRMRRDPYLIAYANRRSGQRKVVTTEHSRPSTLGANRKIPDVCKALGVPCIDTYKFIRELDFRTDSL